MNQSSQPSAHQRAHERIAGGMVGLVVGDALGVPVEFQSREHLRRDPVVGMRGHGSHNQPAGTWSDDSALALVTLENLLEGYNPDSIMAGFARWWSEGYMTAHGTVFDIGNTTSAAIQRFNMKQPREAWGGQSFSENGNGSLMRILPLSVYVSRAETGEIVERSFEISALTHAHILSRLCCAYYSLLVKVLLQGKTLAEAMSDASRELGPYVPDEERRVLARVLNGSIVGEPEDKISGSGYVLHCLEASLWCAARSGSYREAVLAAVNLGKDTDTTAAVTGGLAGIQYGIQGIPGEWLSTIARKAEIMSMANALADVVYPARSRDQD